MWTESKKNLAPGADHTNVDREIEKCKAAKT